jgi:hypothetical protein
MLRHLLQPLVPAGFVLVRPDLAGELLELVELTLRGRSAVLTWI